MSFKIVKYPIPKYEPGGELHVFGDEDAKYIAFLLPGFPDDQSIMMPMAQHLASQGCLVGVSCLPGYQKPPPGSKVSWKDYPAEGFTLVELAACVREAVKELVRHSKNQNAKLTTILFDWGVFPGVVWANQAMAEKKEASTDTTVIAPNNLVLLDVCPPPHPCTKSLPQQQPKSPPPSLHARFAVAAYRIVLAISFCIQSFGFSFLAQPFFTISFLILNVLNLGPLGGKGDEEYTAKSSKENPRQLSQLIYMSYPYYYLLKEAWQGGKNFEFFTLPADIDQTPVLFLYGKMKNTMFHPNKSVQFLQAQEGNNKSRGHGFENAGHFLFTPGQESNACFDEITKFILP